MASHDPTSRPRPSRPHNICFQCVAGLPQFSFDQFPPATMALLCSPNTPSMCQPRGLCICSSLCLGCPSPSSLHGPSLISFRCLCKRHLFREAFPAYLLSLILLPSAASCVSVFIDLTPFHASAFLDFWGLPGTMEALEHRVRGRGQALQAGMVPLLPAC